MSDSSRKRSRKSKLILRECTVESDEEDNLQHTPNAEDYRRTRHLNCIIDINAPSTSKSYGGEEENMQVNVEDDTEPEKDVPIEFDIKVEVENCDDVLAQLMNHYKERDLVINTKRKTSRPRKQSEEFTNCYTLTDTQIVNASKKIVAFSTNLADKVLDMVVRNTVGHEFKGIAFDSIHEPAIQEALDDWKTWQFRSFYRGPPLFYKCYLCNASWWHLQEFREHVTQHSELSIALEMFDRHETNIIAHHKGSPIPKVKLIHTEGLCGRCGKGFDVHKPGFSNAYKYNATDGCCRNFHTCHAVREHVSLCTLCTVPNPIAQCDICGISFSSTELFDSHFSLLHTVRSDAPIVNRYSTCRVCLARYMEFYQHICGKRGAYLHCPYCFRSFPSNELLELHVEQFSKPYTCEICNKYVKWGCSKYQHMLTHTSRFMTVRKCVRCEEFKVFLSKESATLHKIMEHKEKQHPPHEGCFIKIIIPKSSLEPDLEEEEKEELAPPIQNIKEEPLDTDQSNTALENDTNITIKEEPIDEESAYGIYSSDTQFIKQEYESQEEFEIEEYEDDIIKLDFGIHYDYTVKEEPTEEPIGEEPVDVDEQHPIEMQEDNVMHEESSASQADDSTNDSDCAKILEPKVLILKPGKKKERKIYRCAKCGYKGKHKEYKMHVETECEKSDLQLKEFTCTKCNNVYRRMKYYLAHFANHGFEYNSCPECLENITPQNKLVLHVEAHIKQLFVKVKAITKKGSKSKPEYQCKKCNVDVNMSKFFQHWELHVNDRPVAPPTVLKPPKSSNEMEQAAVDKLIDQLGKHPKQCIQCYRHFNRLNECKRHLIEHLLSHALNEKQKLGDIRCQMCGAGFLKADLYKQHMRDHASLPVYKCELCDRTFSDSSNFTKHKKVHNLKVCVCDLCGKKFQSKLSLVKHLQMHETAEPVKCTQCNKTFHFEGAYRRHVRYIHDRQSHGFRCAFCRVKFPSLKEKWDHMWEVHRERKQKADCPICGKSFRKYADVRNHTKREHNVQLTMLCCKSKRALKIGEMLKSPREFRFGNRETLVIYE